MASVPDYRLRLFLSVDLAGSTAFKNGPGADPDGDDPYPKWVTAIRNFYRQFPLMMGQYYHHLSIDHKAASTFGHAPVIWKAVGDELLFCTRLRSREHMFGCVWAFKDALTEYGRHLDEAGKHMDIKGTGWVAAFPAANVTVRPIDPPTTPDFEAGELEDAADRSPSEYDFLGRDIDAGFRIADHASADRFAISVQLAWLLSKTCQDLLLEWEFSYRGYSPLKGVLKDRPYPMISLNAERSPIRRKVREREKALLPLTAINATKIHDFCDDFMRDEQIEFPVLGRHDAQPDQQLPQSYIKFQRTTSLTLKETEQRDAREKEAGSVVDGGSPEMPDEVQNLTLRVLKDAAEKLGRLTPAANTQPKPG